VTLQQGLAFGLVGLTIAAFIWGRWRYDLIALCALVGGLVIGVIPAESAFDGFQNDVTVIIAAALVVSAAFSKSGIIERVLRPVMPLLKTETTQAPFLTIAVTLLSMVTKNVGALAIMMPVALQVARRTGTPPSRLLMPMAFGAMAGGMVTLVGTSPNIIVSGVRQDLLGAPFAMYDYAPVGLALTALIVLYLSFAYRLLPKDRKGTVSMGETLAAKDYATEVKAPANWAFPRPTVSQLQATANGRVRILSIIRERRRIAAPKGNRKVLPGDSLLLEGEAETLGRFVGLTGLKFVRADHPVARSSPTEEIQVIEAVIGGDSLLADHSLRSIDLYGQYGVNLLGVSRSGYELKRELDRAPLHAGDIIMLQGGEAKLAEAMQALDLLPLAERKIRLGWGPRAFMPALVLAIAMTLVGLQVLPVAVAFFGAAVIIVALGGLSMREAYGALDGPLLVLVAAMIPVSATIQETRGADLIAAGLRGLFVAMPPVLAVGGLLLAAMAVTPFLNNAATVLIVAPIGATLATQLGYRPDAFLMAVAVGAACDFLTPIGHQCNTLVMGPGGYKFGDYTRLGLPLSLLVLMVAPPLILMFWPI
jgi:Di- and tricarboxylate transporters